MPHAFLDLSRSLVFCWNAMTFTANNKYCSSHEIWKLCYQIDMKINLFSSPSMCIVDAWPFMKFLSLTLLARIGWQWSSLMWTGINVQMCGVSWSIFRSYSQPTIAFTHAFLEILKIEFYILKNVCERADIFVLISSPLTFSRSFW
jgi:hypothetical protein